MRPFLQPGDEVLLNPYAYRHRAPAVGDLVVARHPFDRAAPPLIKRITAVTEDGRYHVRGDNPDALASSDSRGLGSFSRSQILGQISCRFA